MAAVKRLGIEGMLQESQSTAEYQGELLIRFNQARQAFENRLKELDEETAQRLAPVIQWMKQVITKKAPDLLTT
ncbi:MAG: hypothetical protein ACFFB3_17525 [Candidatus Hodarchaeota archaeon]